MIGVFVTLLCLLRTTRIVHYINLMRGKVSRTFVDGTYTGSIGFVAWDDYGHVIIRSGNIRHDNRGDGRGFVFAHAACE